MSSLSVGLLYLAPFLGGVLGSSISGKVSDIVCRWMTRRNGGIFEPEFRLVLVIPVAIATVMGILPSPSQDDRTVPNVCRTLGIWMVCPGWRPLDCTHRVFRCHWVWLYSRIYRLHFLCRGFLSCRRRILTHLPQLFQKPHRYSLPFLLVSGAGVLTLCGAQDSFSRW